LSQIDRRVRPADRVESLQLNCTSNGAYLAGVPLLQKGIAGLRPRPIHEIAALMNGAYGGYVDSAHLSPGLDVVARALDQGDLGRAMIAAVRLRLPELSGEGALAIARVDAALAKYSPDEPRDEHGRWTADGSGSHVNSAPTQGTRPQRDHRPASPAPTQPRWRPASDQTNGTARLIPVSNGGAANDNLAERVCWAASRQCQISALQDKSRTSYFDACQKAEDICLMILPLSRLKPDQPLGVIFPDRTVVSIQDGGAMLTHLGGVRLKNPLK